MKRFHICCAYLLILILIYSKFSFGENLQPVPNCHQLYDHFCKELYTPKRNGNYHLGTGTSSVDVRMGEDEFGHDLVWRLISDAKLAGMKRADFPKDLLKNLGDYPALLKKYLSFKKVYPMSLKNTLELRKLYMQIMNRWEQAVEMTEIERVENKFPKYYTLHWNKKDPALAIEVTKTEEMVQIDANRSIWEHHLAFLSTLSEFEEVKNELLKIVD